MKATFYRIYQLPHADEASEFEAGSITWEDGTFKTTGVGTNFVPLPDNRYNEERTASLFRGLKSDKKYRIEVTGLPAKPKPKPAKKKEEVQDADNSNK